MGHRVWVDGWKPRETRQLVDAMALMRTCDPTFLLLSGGGDDIAGTPLENYLNHFASGEPPLRGGAFRFLVNTYLHAAYATIITQVRTINASVPIILHGYSYAHADGRGVINGPWGFHYLGPWLRPAFATKRITTIDGVVHELIDAFNEMLGTLHNPAPRSDRLPQGGLTAGMATR